MIHILYYDYSLGFKTQTGERVGLVSIFGPFDCKVNAVEWAERELLVDHRHEWKMTPFKIVGLV